MKKIVIPYNIEQIEENKDMVDGFIIEINGYSVNTEFNIDITELSSIIDLIGDKELFISLNKNVENKELESLKEILLQLKKYSIKGVLYSDVCFINFKDELNINYDLVWAQEHITTNYETINYWNDFGVNYTLLSNDITINEMIEIKKKTNSKLMVPMFGYLPMFVSKRHIVKNYLDRFKLDDNSNINYMEKEGKVYPIVDKKIGTSVYSCNILNGISEYYNLEKSGIEYIILNGFNINNNDFMKVIDIYNKLSLESIEESNDKINNMFDNVDNGFMYQETISRVKKNEK